MSIARPIQMGELPNFQTHGIRYVYAIAEIGEENIIKIGRAAHHLWRISELQMGNRRDLVLLGAWEVARVNAAALERLVHNKFSHRRVAGEWFNVPIEELATFIARVG
ncbi:GIY-YIG nuclease family protein [Agrobacterium rhizogenes]|uniref:GIY-YIG nuclease family protein n=1 Tax=Rhizobium rhizogenes TaxID=359 RepID=UPI001574EC84|nr:GIY-YIG nuclease family protein [Rhizobium rhizogenes]NTG48602.1 GIY-YIG nuclease family protein [Rhizobium rhizogenes]